MFVAKNNCSLHISISYVEEGYLGFCSAQIVSRPGLCDNMFATSGFC